MSSAVGFFGIVSSALDTDGDIRFFFFPFFFFKIKSLWSRLWNIKEKLLGRARLGPEK